MEDLMLKKLLEITEENKRNGIVDVTVSADSVWNGKRITTFVIHRLSKGALQSEFNTHRSLSRNSASSRAINKQKYIENIIKDPYIPVWTSDQKGMVGGLVTDDELVKKYTTAYLNKMLHDIDYVQTHYTDVHKQDFNTQLDQYVRIPIITTGSRKSWEYFFSLRTAPDVKPEFRRIALEMERLYHQYVPTETDFHIPWIRPHETSFCIKDKLILSTARSAWISYYRHDNLDSLEIALKTVQKLWEQKHFSPFDHCAQASLYGKLYDGWEEFRRFYINTI